jgi:hypothetical protein
MTTKKTTDLINAATDLLDWAREHTSPRDANTPHALLVTLANALTAIAAPPRIIDRGARDRRHIAKLTPLTGRGA